MRAGLRIPGKWCTSSGMPDQPEQASSAPQQAIVQRPGKGGVYPPVEYRWQKGCPSPNPLGRRLSSELDKQLSENDTARALIAVLIAEGLAGSVPALKEIFERHEGKVLQSVAQESTQRTIVMEVGMDETPEPLPTPAAGTNGHANGHAT